ncbi:hypothetical protein MES5069_650008 [Mesorhizobium escarrei]|uniref:Uncharacterized protein n=1 Tax=Mesorhizobium escarrei TaxID=666018 RepID=A0ABM9EF76_9HYPH|nr:hypothetical protein MES5069_650008 [Mesorhizobium escarrei]
MVWRLAELCIARHSWAVASQMERRGFFAFSANTLQRQVLSIGIGMM